MENAFARLGFQELNIAPILGQVSKAIPQHLLELRGYTHRSTMKIPESMGPSVWPSLSSLLTIAYASLGAAHFDGFPIHCEALSWDVRNPQAFKILAALAARPASTTRY